MVEDVTHSEPGEMNQMQLETVHELQQRTPNRRDRFDVASLQCLAKRKSAYVDALIRVTRRERLVGLPGDHHEIMPAASQPFGQVHDQHFVAADVGPEELSPQ